MRLLPIHFSILSFLLTASCLGESKGSSPSSPEPIRPFLEQYCVKCHGGEKVKGKLDFVSLLDSGVTLEENFELWALVREVLEFEEMPPEDELQPGDSDRKHFSAWYQEHFIDSVEAKPSLFKPRRLSVNEYRNTLRSLLGFDLEVEIFEAEQTVTEKSLVRKLLPTDPPGESGFTNDTHGNPLTTVIWDQYSYLVDRGLNELFSEDRAAERIRLLGSPQDGRFTVESAKSALQTFASRAWRRTVPPEEMEPFFQRIEGAVGDEMTGLMKREMKTMLMSSRFFYRGLLAQGVAGEQTKVDGHELAERLSYFLWADMPDEELSRLAELGELAEPVVLKEQIERLLNDPASRNLAENFAVEWLALDGIEGVSNNPPVSDALVSQPLDFMDHLFREDRPLMELVDSETSFINMHTAKFYPVDRKQLANHQKQKGIEVESLPNQRIKIEHNAESRGGILTMPGVLAMNRGPVIRGTWMLERILGDHLGEPPPNVGQVPVNQGGEKLSFRELFEKHRANVTCAVCHDKIDPLGFSLQAYDDQGVYLRSKEAIAATRKKKDSGEIKIPSLDTTGQLPTGETFTDFADLKSILMTTQRRAVVRNLVERTLSYALCRKLEIYDQPTIDEITDRLIEKEGTFRGLVHEVVFSLPFQETIFPDANS